jgi:hypothetical protein
MRKPCVEHHGIPLRGNAQGQNPHTPQKRRTKCHEVLHSFRFNGSLFAPLRCHFQWSRGTRGPTQRREDGGGPRATPLYCRFPKVKSLSLLPGLRRRKKVWYYKTGEECAGGPASRLANPCQGYWLVKGRQLDDPNHGDGGRAFPQQASLILQHA